MQPLLKFARKPLLWCALAVAVVGGVAFAVWPREPVYEGQPLSYWLERLPASLPSPSSTEGRLLADDVKHAEGNRARRAVNALGVQCLPTLLRRLKTNDAWAMTLFRIKHLLPHQESITSMVIACQFKRGQAATALILLGDTAKPILPDIIKLTQCDPNPRIHAYALMVLRNLSPADYAQLTGQTNVVTAAMH